MINSNKLFLPIFLCILCLPTLISHVSGNNNKFSITHIADTTDQKYSVLLRQYTKGKKDTQFLYDLSYLALKEKDSTNAAKIAADYLKKIKHPISDSNLRFISNFTFKSSDAGFKYYIKNSERIDSTIKENSLRNKVISIIYQEDIAPIVENNTSQIDWNSLIFKAQNKYHSAGEEIALKAKYIYYFNEKKWDLFTQSFDPYYEKYGSNLPDFELNNYAMNIFSNIEDKQMLLTALKWSKKTLIRQDQLTYAYMDTYANLLYKLGKKEDAIQMEEKALKIVPSREKAAFESTLQKMRSGDKTW